MDLIGHLMVNILKVEGHAKTEDNKVSEGPNLSEHCVAVLQVIRCLPGHPVSSQTASCTLP